MERTTLWSATRW